MNPNRDLVRVVSQKVCEAKSKVDGITADMGVVESHFEKDRKLLERAKSNTEKAARRYSENVITARIGGHEVLLKEKKSMLKLAKEAYECLLEIEHQAQSIPCREHADVWHHPNERCAACVYDDGIEVVEESAIE